MNKTPLYIIIALILMTIALVWYRAEKTIVTVMPLDTIIVGTNAEFQPFSFKHNGVITGFDIEVIAEVLKRMDKKMVIKDMPFDALVPEIQLGNIHIIAAGITPTPERAEQAKFTRPHLAAGNPLVIVSLKNNISLTSINDLVGKIVAVNEGYVADFYISEQPGVHAIRLSSPSVSDGILAIESGRADAFITALYPIKPFLDIHGTNKFVVTPIPKTEESSAFAISKYYPELRDYIQVTLDRMEEDGTLAALKTKWNLS